MRTTLLVFLAAGALTAAAQQSPFDGTWKLNKDKSRLAGETMTIEKSPDGMIRSKSGALEMKFRADGKEYPHPLGYTMTFKENGDRRWQSTMALKGKVMATADWQLSADGRTLTITVTGTKPNGEPFKEVVEHARTSPGDGLYGTWQSRRVDSQSPDELVIKTGGDGTMTLSIPAWQYTVKTKFDGNDYPVTGPTIPPGATASAQKSGPNSIELSLKKDGKVFMTEKLEVSGDGKTLTDTMQPAGGKDKPTVAVFEKK